jgi:DNA-binding NarL/FixJ family response regulator
LSRSTSGESAGVRSALSRFGTNPQRRDHRILVVDDDPAICKVIRQILGGCGYPVLTVDSVTDALEELHRGPIAVVLLDLKLRDSHGMALLEELHDERWHGTAVVVVSGTGTMDDVINALRHRAIDYVRKPFYPEDLIAVVDRAVASRERQARRSERPETTDDPALALTQQEREALSTREIDVFREIARGRRMPPIAQTLHVSPHTVRNHLKAVFRKLGVHSQSDVVELVLRRRAGRRRD